MSKPNLLTKTQSQEIEMVKPEIELGSLDIS